MVLRVQTRPASGGERFVGALVDGFAASIAILVVWMFYGWFLVLFPVPEGTEVVTFGSGLCLNSSSCNYEWFAENSSAGPTFWVSLVITAAVFLAMSGATSRTRRSPGMLATGTYPVPVASLGSESVEPPSRRALLARWVVVGVAFTAGVTMGGGGWGIALVALLWLPSVFGPRRSVYDWLTGVAVVDISARDVTVSSEPAATADPAADISDWPLG